jgi:hypothetical protein
MTKMSNSPPKTLKKSPPAPTQEHIQGEGDYEAARRYRDGVEKFVHNADIEAAARAAAPHDEREAKEMAAAEALGRSHANEPKPLPRQTSRKT